jgi:ABC-type nitrate/sulfonate/bicarbonate transport system permease component
VSLAYPAHGRELPRVAARLGGAAGIVLVLAVWELLARTVLASSLVLPTPFTVAQQMWHDRHFYVPHIETTLHEAALGFLWGNAIAIAVAIVFVLVPVIEHSLMRLAIAIYCLPLLAIGPILQIVQSEEGPKITLAALSVFFTTLIATMLGLRSADPASLELIHVFGGGTLDALRKVRVRAALPALLAGLRIAAPAALLGAIIGELLGGTQGLGVAMVESQSSFEVSRTWGIALVTGALAGIGYALVSLAGRVLTPWAGREQLLVTSAPKARVPRRPFVRIGQSLGLLALSFALMIAAWYGLIHAFNLDPYFAKDPGDVYDYLMRSPDAAANRSELLGQFKTTVIDAGIGYLAGTAAALVVAALVVTQRAIEQTLMPVAIVLRSVPLVAMTPLIALVFGRGLLGVTVIVGIVTFFPTLVNLIIGMRSAPQLACDFIHAYGGSKLTALRKVRFQYALPAFFASARIAAPTAIGGATLAEWLATGKGAGNLMLVASSSSRFDTLWSAVALIVLVSVAVYGLVGVLESFVLGRYAPEQLA